MPPMPWMMPPPWAMPWGMPGVGKVGKARGLWVETRNEFGLGLGDLGLTKALVTASV
jgi:hypothetical protein